MHLLHVVGARPNFMKAAPVLRALAMHSGVQQTLVHTGQHYDATMSDVFFKDLAMPAPDVNLQVGSGSHGQQTAEVMYRFEPVLCQRKPDLVLVYGDVNSTMAAALVCAKLQVPVGHVEAGLRSFDRMMPEEINRVVTDQLADLLFTPSQDGTDNLLREGVAPHKIHLVGNVMIDSLTRLLPRAEERWGDLRRDLVGDGKPHGDGKYALATLHRPSNVDEPERLSEIMQVLCDIAPELPVIFPVHPRTRNRLWHLQRKLETASLRFIEPLGYLDFLALECHATVVITDSGGVQEETTFLGVPCLTLRANTERPVTTVCGTNTLIGDDIGRLRSELSRVLHQDRPHRCVPPLWDGKASERIAEVILSGQGCSPCTCDAVAG